MGDPASAMILSSIIMGGTSIAGGLMAPEGQELSTFEGTEADPTQLLSHIIKQIGGQYQQSATRAQESVQLPSSFVQGLPTFTGGGLPMPIGVRGRDPMLAPDGNSSLQGNVRRRVSMGEPQATGNMQGEPTSDFGLPDFRSTTATPRRRGTDLLSGQMPSSQPQPGVGPDDEFSRALGAADLLRMTLSGGR